MQIYTAYVVLSRNSPTHTRTKYEGVSAPSFFHF
nr:MAG TPA: hypothetical protein [Caudoviricetes sp.]